jgi:hypothetical protein
MDSNKMGGSFSTVWQRTTLTVLPFAAGRPSKRNSSEVQLAKSAVAGHFPNTSSPSEERNILQVLTE